MKYVRTRVNIYTLEGYNELMNYFRDTEDLELLDSSDKLEDLLDALIIKKENEYSVYTKTQYPKLDFKKTIDFWEKTFSDNNIENYKIFGAIWVDDTLTPVAKYIRGELILL